MRGRIAAAAALLDLDRVVIGGGVALGAGELLLGPLRRALGEDARLAFTRGIEARVLLSDLGIVAALAGAAGLLRGLAHERGALSPDSTGTDANLRRWLDG